MTIDFENQLNLVLEELQGGGVSADLAKGLESMAHRQHTTREVPDESILGFLRDRVKEAPTPPVQLAGKPQ